jgi:ABC-type nickel/cobalt efflux system permease component RcnA
MGVLEISRSWIIGETLKKLELQLNLLENVDIPVKWVVLIFPGDTGVKRLYRVVKRGEAAYYDFHRYAWVDDKGRPLSSGDESTVWGRLVQFTRVGFSHISLEKVFKSTENPWVMLLYLFIAIIIGAIHSLSPGHGKALIGAYIIGTKGTVSDAITLGIVTAASHTISVLILGVILLIAFNSVVPDNIASYLNIVSGIIIVIIGIYLLRRRFREMKNSTHSHEHSHAHDGHDNHHHDHAHGHDHQHITMESIQKNSMWTNVMMGISGGMVPCPTALVVLFLAISLKKLALGLVLIIFFSFGLAATLTTLGILFAKGSKLIDRYDNNRIVARLPIISAGIIVVLGTVIFIRALIGIV